MSPMEELIYLCIKKGINTPERLSKKIGKAVNYVHVYTRQLKYLGLITTNCPTCKGNAYFACT